MNTLQINNSNVQRPQGQRGFNGNNGVNGAQGQQGLQGPPGITQLNNTNTYLVTTNVVNDQTTSNRGKAICNPGDFVVIGGFFIINPPGH